MEATTEAQPPTDNLVTFVWATTRQHSLQLPLATVLAELAERGTPPGGDPIALLREVHDDTTELEAVCQHHGPDVTFERTYPWTFQRIAVGDTLVVEARD
jgi:hypothetical protein